eukprot:965938_1
MIHLQSNVQGYRYCTASGCLMNLKRLMQQKHNTPWHLRMRGQYVYVVVIILFMFIFISYIANICILASHDDTAAYSNVVLLRADDPDEENAYDPCHLNHAQRHKIYIYDLPYFYREQPRKHWYRWIHGKQLIYDTPSALNFAFGTSMNLSAYHKDFYHTHQHSLEILLNERFKSESTKDKYFTKNASEAVLFHIPFPFAMHFRFYNVRDWDLLISHHTFVMEWLSDSVTNTSKIKDIALQQRESAVFKHNFLTEDHYKPHWISYTRIAHETDRLQRKHSPFWLNENTYSETNHLSELHSPFWHVSIDRNCGDPRQCLKRISVPHPSVFHPQDIETLKSHVDRLKVVDEKHGRNILVSFCGAIRTSTREKAHEVCTKYTRNKWGKWWHLYNAPHQIEICRFEDSLEYEKLLKSEHNVNSALGRKIRTEIDYSKKCVQIYEKSTFCIQEGADSTTRKGLWDGIISGCIPVFLNGVMDTAEFECFVGNNYPWYLVLRKENYIQQLMSLPQQFVKQMQQNIKRMIPKIIYTNGDSGFPDAFDVLMHCLIRKTAWENKIDHPQCTIDNLVGTERMYDLERVLGFDALYKYLEI